MSEKLEIPDNWAIERLGNVIEFEYGKGLIKASRNENGEYDVYGSNGIVGKHTNYLIKDPCVIIGRKGAAGEVHIATKPCWPIDTTYFVRGSKLFNLNYLYYQLKNLRLVTLEKSTAIPGLNRNDAYRKRISIPPLREQHRIVAKIEELFSELDKGVEALKTTQQQLKVYRQAVLKWAFEGKLTEEWRRQQKNLPAASQLLEQIKAERKKKANANKKKLKPIAPLMEAELAVLPVLPREWCWKKLFEIAERIQIGPFGSQLHQDEYQETGIPIINPKHIKGQKIHPNERILLQKAEELSQYILRTNDIILGRRGEMGRSAPITEDQNGWFCGTGSLFIRLCHCFNSKLFSLILSERRVINYLEKQSIGTTMTNLNSDILNNLPIQVIPMLEQEQIVQEIETRLSVADKLEETISQSLQQAEALRQSILKKAFAGKLVPQDPNDEPASKLLERIKAERASQAPVVKKSKINRT